MRTGSQGFTLIELVVALAVLSLLSLLVLQALNIAHQAWDRGTQAAERLDAIASVQQALRRSVATLLPLQDPGLCGGTGQSLSFLAHAPDGNPTTGTARYNLTIEPEGAGTQLSVSWCAYTPGSTSCEAGKASKEVVLDGADTASIAYFADGRWQDKWSDCSKPPQLVRIDARFANQDRRIWPLLVIRPLYAVSADCRFDQVSMKCRQS